MQIGLVLAALGCEGRGPATVTGTVTFDGTKLQAGTVGFHPESGGVTPHYVSVASDGTYNMTTEAVPTIPAGTYAVTIVGQEPVVQKPGAPAGHGKQITPDRYADKTQTPLRVKVVPGANAIDLAVTTN